MTSNYFVAHPSDIERYPKVLDISDAITVERYGNTHTILIHHKGSTLSFNNLNASVFGGSRILVDDQVYVEDGCISYNSEMRQYWLEIAGKDVQFDTFTGMIKEAVTNWIP